MVMTSGADLLHRVAVHLLAHAHDDADRVSALVAALDAGQTLYRTDIPLVTIPASTGSDPRLRAIKASVVERLVEVWRTPPHDRYDERAPSWCAMVMPLTEPLWLIDCEYGVFELSRTFEKRNILALPNFLMFV